MLHDINVGFIIQARLGSTRFPGKVLLPIPLTSGKEMILWITDELKKFEGSSKIIVATTTNHSDQKLADFCEERSIEYYRGSEEDVYSRFLEISKNNHFDVIVRLTGDNPIIDIDAVTRVIKHHLLHGSDYTGSEGLPLGMNIECIDPSAFSEEIHSGLNKDEKEHVTLHIRNCNRYNKSKVQFGLDDRISNLRATIDYPSDYLVISNVLSFYRRRKLSGLKLIQYVHKKYPWIFKVNRNNYQIKTFDNVEDEVNAATELLERSKLLQAKQLLLKTYRILKNEKVQRTIFALCVFEFAITEVIFI
jgi:spore coat polysaccharide biosynthesis protein SpsF